MASEASTDEKFAEEILDRMVDQSEATVGDEGVVYVGDEDDFGRFISGLVSLSQRNELETLASVEPTSVEEMAKVLVAAPRQLLVRLERDQMCPCYVWYDGDRAEFRAAVYDGDDERPSTPALGDTGTIHDSVWNSYFERAVDGEMGWRLLQQCEAPSLVEECVSADSADNDPSDGHTDTSVNTGGER